MRASRWLTWSCLAVLGACSSSASGPALDPADDDETADDDTPGTTADAGRRDPDAAIGPDADPGPDAPPALDSPGPQTVDEETDLTVTLPATHIRRFDAVGLPPGATLDPQSGVLSFHPDFTQSGQYAVTVTGYAGGPPATFTKSVQFTITVPDSLTPPAPVVVSTTSGPGYTLLTLRQTTDDFLDSPANAGRTFDATLSVPTALAQPGTAPAQVWFHGFGGAPRNTGVDSYFRLSPHDPNNTYWYGYGDAGDNPTTGHIQPYTERRALNLYAWMRATYPQIDTERIFTGGDSMGGAGALTVALRHARHFAGALTTIGETIPRHHHVARIETLRTWWGTPEANLDDVWDALDLTRVLRDDAQARDQFVSTKHGKDDKQILFTTVVKPSPLTGASFYDTLESEHVGHLCMWDEGGHGTNDPLLGAGWYDAGWSRMFDAKARLRRDLPFPAFSHSTANDDPGNMTGNGKVAWTELGGFAGNEATPGDTGWNGAIAGALNRFLRWDATGTEVSRDLLRLPLYLVSSPGEPSPKEGYPTKRDLYTGSLPIRADVTPRRTHAFRPLPGETVHWQFGEQQGDAIADADGSVTLLQLPIMPTPTVLELRRDAP